MEKIKYCLFCNKDEECGKLIDYGVNEIKLPYHEDCHNELKEKTGQ
ncbi:hypothetical protein [Robertmurraya siralis]|nr:hypothetical protein [Robertmurraya siralis]